jgi:membrane protein YqaA with SNARE-associated domain
MPNDDGGGRGNPSALATHVPAAAWGFAEATLFFIIPDVLLSWIALDRMRPAAVACLWATAGALLGGIVMYSWGATDLGSAERAMASVPDFRHGMPQDVKGQIERFGAVALFSGPITGRPYKLYAVYAGAAGINLLVFLLISVPARLMRMLLTMCVSGIMAQTVFKSFSLAQRRMLHVGVWLVFYCWFFLRSGS